MRQLRTVPLSMVLVAVTVILMAAVEVPRLGAGTAVAAQASLEAAFRDLPASVLTGEILKIQVDAPSGATCEGTIVYRDNSVQALKQISVDDKRCRWDVIVPEATRRGEADVAVTVKENGERVTLSATIAVGRSADNIGLMLKELPANVKRNSDFSIRLDVPDKSTCQGVIAYVDEKTQTLDPQTENRMRCRWDLTAPADVSRGTARVTIVVSHEGRQRTLVTSFEVSRDNEDADVLIAFQDLPTSIRRDATLPIRVLAPLGATCTGEVTFRAAENARLDEVREQSGLCRWSAVVPEGAKRGESEVTVKVKAEGKDAAIKATVVVDESSADVDASFKDLPASIRRGDELEVRVSVPDGASCQGDVTFDDGAKRTLDSQVERKDRCLWSLKVPVGTPRGPALVRIVIDDHGFQTTLTGNVMVQGREDELLAASWGSVPKEARRGEELEVAVSVATGSSCVGKIAFPEGMRWTLGNTAEDDAYCRWSVQVPVHVAPGKAQIEVKIEKDGETSTLTSELDVKAS